MKPIFYTINFKSLCMSCMVIQDLAAAHLLSLILSSHVSISSLLSHAMSAFASMGHLPLLLGCKKTLLILQHSFCLSAFLGSFPGLHKQDKNSLAWGFNYCLYSHCCYFFICSSLTWLQSLFHIPVHSQDWAPWLLLSKALAYFCWLSNICSDTCLQNSEEGGRFSRTQLRAQLSPMFVSLEHTGAPIVSPSRPSLATYYFPVYSTSRSLKDKEIPAVV